MEKIYLNEITLLKKRSKKTFENQIGLIPSEDENFEAYTSTSTKKLKTSDQESVEEKKLLKKLKKKFRKESRSKIYSNNLRKMVYTLTPSVIQKEYNKFSDRFFKERTQLLRNFEAYIQKYEEFDKELDRIIKKGFKSIVNRAGGSIKKYMKKENDPLAQTLEIHIRKNRLKFELESRYPASLKKKSKKKITASLVIKIYLYEKEIFSELKSQKDEMEINLLFLYYSKVEKFVQDKIYLRFGINPYTEKFGQRVAELAKLNPELRKLKKGSKDTWRKLQYNKF